jgi:Plasmid pRiA4b ORF-3-like protein.
MNFAPKDKFRYVYDFGDDWRHDIVVEKVLDPDEGIKYPVCIGGKRNCPPEDVGGPWGYEDFLEAIQDPQHPEHESMLEWVGGSFDPEEFSIDEVNDMLKMIK